MSDTYVKYIKHDPSCLGAYDAEFSNICSSDCPLFCQKFSHSPSGSEGTELTDEILNKAQQSTIDIYHEFGFYPYLGGAAVPSYQEMQTILANKTILENASNASGYGCNYSFTSTNQPFMTSSVVCHDGSNPKFYAVSYDGSSYSEQDICCDHNHTRYRLLPIVRLAK